jgi:hypothetical protein
VSGSKTFLPTPQHPSKQIRQWVTMALSAALTHWYCHPPFVDNIRGWDKFFMNSPCSFPSNGCSFDFNFLVPPKFHGQNYLTLASTPGIIFHCTSSPSFLASSRKTLKTSLFYPPCTTNFHINGKEVTQFELNQRNNDCGERNLPPPASKERPVVQWRRCEQSGEISC